MGSKYLDMYYFLLIFVSSMLSVNCLTCVKVLEAEETKKWSIDDLKSMVPKDIVSCLAHLSKERMPIDTSKYIWKTLVDFYNGAGNIPQDKLILLHFVTVAIEPEDYENMTLDSVDVIQNFGLNYELSSAQLSAIADRVREDWGGKEPEDYSFYDLIALRQILCAFNKSEIQRIHPKAFKEAVRVLAHLSQCSEEVLAGFAWLATQDEAFGPVNTWNSAILTALGSISNQFPEAVKNKIKENKKEQKNTQVVDKNNTTNMFLT